jgi:hypothetical protein
MKKPECHGLTLVSSRKMRRCRILQPSLIWGPSIGPHETEGLNPNETTEKRGPSQCVSRLVLRRRFNSTLRGRGAGAFGSASRERCGLPGALFRREKRKVRKTHKGPQDPQRSEKDPVGWVIHCVPRGDGARCRPDCKSWAYDKSAILCRSASEMSCDKGDTLQPTKERKGSSAPGAIAASSEGKARR